MTRPLVVRESGREIDGVVRDAESWLAAARRTCGALVGEPVPGDLSGSTLLFDVEDDLRVDLRAMTHDDLDLAVAWRSDPVVRRWWSPGEIPDHDAIAQKYAERIDGLSPTRMWVVMAGEHPVGFVQDYRSGDYPASLRPGADPDAVGIDYALGDPAWRGRGLGVRMLWAWALRAHHRFADVAAYVAAPDVRNAASLRILAKAGFTPGASRTQTDADGRTETVMDCTLDVRTVLGSAAGSA